MNNNRGWIQIVEAFVAILLVAGVVLFVLNQNYFGKGDTSEEVYKIEVSILREIQLNDTMRNEILSAEGDLPIENKDEGFPENVRKKINERAPSYLECEGNICSIEGSCVLEESKEKDVYSQSVIITATLQGTGYRKLNIFCWTK